MQDRVWRRAATHPNGKGLEEGIDFKLSTSLTRKLRKSSRYGDAALMECIQCDGLWNRDMKFAAGLVADAGCKRCLAQPPETLTHLHWECPANNGIPVEEVRASQTLRISAAQGLASAGVSGRRG